MPSPGFFHLLARVKSNTLRNLPLLALALALTTGSASAVTAFTETFNTGANGWLTGTSVAPTYNATGGVGDSGYISFTHTFTSGTSGTGGSPPLQLMFRGNNAADASGDAFVGNWINDGVQSLTLTVRHNYSTSLNFYSRIASLSTSGRGASLAPQGYLIPANTWTTITIQIADNLFDAGTNPNGTFLSYGAGNFNTVFSDIQDLQFGFYVPASTTLTNFRMDIDNVSVAVVPEPASLGLVAFAGAGFVLRRRRARA